MKLESPESAWPDGPGPIGARELAGMCHLTSAELQELVEYGLLVPLGGTAAAPIFSAGSVDPLRRAAALRVQFDLDLFVMGLLFTQFEHVARLEQQVHSLQAHLPHPDVVRDGPAHWHEPHG